jgi:hypothetical protein
MASDTRRQIKSRKRVADHGEVLTADREVNAMLDMVKHETERIDSRFLEPSCGNGNFLAEILRRKLKIAKDRYGHSPLDYGKRSVAAVASIYGIDILRDNVQDCVSRLFDIFNAEYSAICGLHATDECREAVRHILRRNIICGDALAMKTLEGGPIILSEWLMGGGGSVKRRDFRLDEIIRSRQYGRGMPLQAKGNAGKTGTRAPQPVKEYPPVSYTKVQTCK